VAWLATICTDYGKECRKHAAHHVTCKACADASAAACGEVST
jgi:hypothetical protein